MAKKQTTMCRVKTSKNGYTYKQNMSKKTGPHRTVAQQRASNARKKK